MAIREQSGLKRLDPSPRQTVHDKRRPRPVVVLFAATAFLGAALLFIVEPLAAKMLLPTFGGSATVWSTCTLFFQISLLAAYAYTHVSTNWLGPRWQPRSHLLLLLLPLLVLPLAEPGRSVAAAQSPVLGLLLTLVVLLGLPFLVVSTTGPLLQRWYSWTEGQRSHDPYFLFAASNLGSFIGLLSYPFLIEPHISLGGQRAWWSAAYAVFLVLTGACALVAQGSRRPARISDLPQVVVRTPLSMPVALRWAGLAFLPSSLMLGVTAHLSTDVAAIPLLWVVPLALYLATFVVAFARTSRQVPVRAARLAAALAAGSLVFALGGGLPVMLSLSVSLVMLTSVSYAAHGRLAAERPGVDRLTAFYLIIAVGGALGGLLNGLLAPLVFESVLEYPLVLAAVPVLLLGRAAQSDAGVLSLWQARSGRASVTAAIVVLIGSVAIAGRELSGSSSFAVLAFATAVIVLFLARSAVIVCALSTALLVASLLIGHTGLLEQSRTFYGMYRVFDSGDQHILVHGTTVHGTQFVDDRRFSPSSYYAPSGPVGDVFRDVDRPIQMGVVGLGVGTLGAYGKSGDSITFYEIDQQVVELARDPKFFTYLSDSPATIRTVVDDGRLGIAAEPAGRFDLLVLDAFSSDAVPIHLLTEEAMRLYANRIADDGLMLVNISNRVFDFRPVLASASKSLGWRAALGNGGSAVDGGKFSVWVALSPDRDRIDALITRPAWRPLEVDRQVRWTDDYSSVLSVLQ